VNEKQDDGGLAAFELTDVCRVRDGTRILDDVTLQIPRGGFTALIGPSGAGKSSLLRLLNRLDDPTSGTIRYHDTPIQDLSVCDHRRHVGFVFQTPVVFAGTVRDNLAVAASIARIDPRDVDHRMIECLQLAEVDRALLDRDTSGLSVGQKHRVCIARTLMSGPETLLLDEPTAALDPETATRLMTTIARLRTERGVTVVAATHRLQEAKDISNFVVMLDHGRIVEAGPTHEIFENASRPRIRAFLESVS
jgi:putative ABC transport system ATP-binding protein